MAGALAPLMKGFREIEQSEKVNARFRRSGNLETRPGFMVLRSWNECYRMARYLPT